MDVPKPHPPVKNEPVPEIKEEIVAAPVKKQPYILKPHMTQKPFKDNADLARLKAEQGKNLRPSQKKEIRRVTKNMTRRSK